MLAGNAHIPRRLLSIDPGEEGLATSYLQIKSKLNLLRLGDPGALLPAIGDVRVIPSAQNCLVG